MSVQLLAWNESYALAIVDGVRVKVDRLDTRCKWRCDEHGDRRNLGHCAHTLALADHPQDPTKYRPHTREESPR